MSKLKDQTLITEAELNILAQEAPEVLKLNE